MKFSIIIVSWNVKNFLEKCLQSLEKIFNEEMEIIIIDNFSKDESREFLKSFRQKNKKIKVIFNEKNVGFAKAINQGIKIASGENIILLNPDTLIYENVFDKIFVFLNKEKKCGIAGCKLLNPDNTIQRSVRRFPSLLAMIIIFLKLHHIFPELKSVRKYLAQNFDYSKTQEVDQVMGAFFYFPRKILDKIGFFDENFFIWFEEVDFCRRVRNAGYKIFYIAEASIIHFQGQSFKQRFSLEKQKIFNASAIYYFKKHGGRLQATILKIISPLSLILAWLQDKILIRKP